MKNSVKILQYIREVLIEELSERENLFIDGNLKLYPIDALEGTDFPFVVMQRTRIIPEYTKDGNSCDNVYVTVLCVASSYDESVEILEDIRTALECKRGTFSDGFKILDIRCEDFSENIYRDAYIQGIDLKITV